MNDSNGYAVFLFPQALEALGEAVHPFLQDGPTGPHILCNSIDTGGAFIEMTLEGHSPEGREVSLELMIPSGMVRMIVSTHSDEMFGFGAHMSSKPAAPLPVLGPTAEPANAPSEALPSSAADHDEAAGGAQGDH
ncbi:MAG: hypothetical protein E6Q88_15185 [Lysobacteraceae bacterium]|nr:MAG: hypothetical protein E6Q88_15185 [Xanthomonadaceae bacterium]